MKESFLNTEQEYILNSNLEQVYSIYRELWKDILIPRDIYYEKDITQKDKEKVIQDIKEGHNVMYKQKDAVVVDFLTSRSTISERFDPVLLSSFLGTTVVDYSNWEDISIKVVSKGVTELSLSSSYDGTTKYSYDHNGRFKNLMQRFEKTKDSKVLGYDLEIILSTLGINLKEIYIPNVKDLQEAVTFDVYGEW
jgi:hypothetical protein